MSAKIVEVSTFTKVAPELESRPKNVTTTSPITIQKSGPRIHLRKRVFGTLIFFILEGSSWLMNIHALLVRR